MGRMKDSMGDDLFSGGQPKTFRDRPLAPARRERDEAIERVERGANDEWLQTVRSVVRLHAASKKEFLSDDIINYMAEAHPDVKTRDKRALGPVMVSMQKAGVIRNTGKYAPSRRRHATPMIIWIGR